MNALVALGLVFLIYSIGDSSPTRQRPSSLCCWPVRHFHGRFLAGPSQDDFCRFGLIAFAKITLCMFLIHIGTAIKINDFVKEWKTVFVTFFATLAVAGGVSLSDVCSSTLLRLVGARFYRRSRRLSGHVPHRRCPGTPRYQGLCRTGPGVPEFRRHPHCQFFFCKKEGDRVRTEFNNGTLTGGETEKHLNLRLFHIPEKYSTPNIILCKLCFVSYISMLLAQATGISILIFGLIFGIILHELGLLEENCLTQANALTFVMAAPSP